MPHRRYLRNSISTCCVLRPWGRQSRKLFPYTPRFSPTESLCPALSTRSVVLKALLIRQGAQGFEHFQSSSSGGGPFGSALSARVDQAPGAQGNDAGGSECGFLGCSTLCIGIVDALNALPLKHFVQQTHGRMFSNAQQILALLGRQRQV